MKASDLSDAIVAMSEAAEFVNHVPFTTSEDYRERMRIYDKLIYARAGLKAALSFIDVEVKE